MILTGAYLKYVDYVTPNETEAEYFAGISQSDYPLNEWAKRCADKFIKMGAGHVVITLGGTGASFSDSNKTAIYPAYKINAVDSTAAGDAFNGAFAYALALNMDIGAAMKTACAGGALTASRAGAQTSIPYKSEINAMIANA